MYFYTNNTQTPAVPRIVAFARGDVNGDRIPDNVYLTGTKSPDSPFIQNITLVIQDGRTGQMQSTRLASDAGYQPRLFLGDFTGDGVADIQVTIDSGGSGATIYSYIYSDLGNRTRLLFDYSVYNDRYKYTVTYMDHYRVKVVSLQNNQSYIIDISGRGSEYLDEIYTKDGKLKKPIEGWVNPLSGLYPVDFDSNGVYELLAFQRIAGQYNADSLGYMLNFLKWDGSGFTIYDQLAGVYGSPAQSST